MNKSINEEQAAMRSARSNCLRPIRRRQQLGEDSCYEPLIPKSKNALQGDIQICTYKSDNTRYAMIVEWDDDKAATNLIKHNVAFALAQNVWSDRGHVIVFDRYENGEERWHAIGLVHGVLILTVSHTQTGKDDEIIRIISARKATAHERKRYEAQDD